jgi:hypothetical protein
MRIYSVRVPSKRFIGRIVGIRRRPELVVSISSIIIAVAALSVAVWQGQATIRHDRLMVKPHVTIWRAYESEKEPCFRLELRNYGLGPAFIAKVRALVGDQAYSVDTMDQWGMVMQQIGMPDSGYAVITGEMIVPSGGILTILKIGSATGDWRKKIGRLGLKVRYRSAYDENYLAVLPAGTAAGPGQEETE